MSTFENEFDEFDDIHFIEDSILAVGRAIISDLVPVIERSRFKTKKKRKFHRETLRKTSKESFWQSFWGKLLSNNDINDSTSRSYKRFRLTYRLPPPLFFRLVDICKEKNVFESKRNGKIPLEFKLMICLRILARDNLLDDIGELFNVGKTTAHELFLTFIRNMSGKLLSEYVKVPVGEEFEKLKETYTKLGFPGCIGSIDCTHIAWDNCPVGYTNLNTGKEGYPTVSFEVVADHHRRILNCSNYFFGSASDKNIVRNDPFPVSVLDGTFAEQRNLSFELSMENGMKMKWDGCYFLSDQGYLRVFGFVDPISTPLSREESLFSEWIESVRKDVECTFGILKSRFRFLRNKVRSHTADILQQAFQTCCILHNMLLDFSQGEEINWEALDANVLEMVCFPMWRLRKLGIFSPSWAPMSNQSNYRLHP
jgi:hypothetical protein